MRLIMLRLELVRHILVNAALESVSLQSLHTILSYVLIHMVAT